MGTTKDVSAAAAPSDGSKASLLHRRAIVIDAVCPGIETENSWMPWISGGATVAGPTVALNEGSKGAIAKIATWFRWMRAHADQLIHVRQVSDISRAKSEGKLGILFHFQNSTPLDREVGMLEVYHRLGVRMVQLCYNQKSWAGDGSFERADGGLSTFGLKVVREMNRLGIVVDCVHAGHRTAMEAIEASEAPPVISHANARSLCNNRRNVWDEAIKAVAAKRGLVGVVAFPSFVTLTSNPSISDYLNHIDYIVNLVGIDHVALGIDFYDGGNAAVYAELLRVGEWEEPDIPPCPHIFPTGLRDATELPNITRGLLARSHSEEDIEKILGGNWMRVFGEVWK